MTKNCFIKLMVFMLRTMIKLQVKNFRQNSIKKDLDW